MKKWKLITKSKLQYFPKILGAEKEHKHQGEMESFIGFS